MAKDIQAKKRKASAPEADIEQVKKVKKTAPAVAEAAVKKRKAIEEAAPTTVKKSKRPQSTEDAPSTRSTRKSKAVPEISDDVVPTSISKASKKKVNGERTSKKAKEAVPEDFIPEEEEVDVQDDEGSDSDIDDQTEALLKGFESEGDEADDVNEGLEDGQTVPKVPKLSGANKKKLEKAKGDDEAPGVVYVGRIPHGFYEYEMREYFKQFGDILKLRLSRNRKSGASRHYAFIQFESATVADIVAKTMDNYLLFGHILKVKTVPEEQLPANIWKGANKRFKRVPWNKLEGRNLKQGASEATWEKRNLKEEERRAKKKEKLAALDYEFEAPALKSPAGAVEKKKAAKITNGASEVAAVEDAEPVLAIEAAPTEVAEKPKKGKKSKKETPVVVTETVVEEVEVVPASSPKVKKTKKTKVVEVTEEVSAAPAEVEKVKKGKKAKGKA